MEALAQAVSAVRERIARFRKNRDLNEENTKATLIDPILRALGWNLEDLDEVQREYKAKRRDKPVDYGLFLMRMPKLFIEAKALHQDLGDRKWLNQIMGYAAVAGVEWVLLTNGDEYRIYNAHAAVDVDQKLFRTFRISANDGAAEETLTLLSREHLRENRLQALWDAHFVDRQAKVALDELFEPGDDASLVRLLSTRISGVSPADIRASLRRARVEVTFPAPTEEIPDSARRPDVPPRSKPKNTDPHLRLAKGTRRTPAAIGVSVGDLVSAGLLRPPVESFAKYRGVEVRARIDADGVIHVDGTSTTSVWSAAAANTGRETVLRARGTPKQVQTNGWVFWSLTDGSGQPRSVESVRQEYLATRADSARAK